MTQARASAHDPASHAASRNGRALNDDIIPLAAGFGNQRREDWLALVDKTLKGRPLETLASKTRDGIAVQALYRSQDAAAATAIRAQPRDPARPWDLRTVVRHPDLRQANADILKDLEGGAASVVVSLPVLVMVTG